MLNFFITDNNWFIAIPIVILFILFERSLFQATIDWSSDERQEMRLLISAASIMISICMYVIPAGLLTNQVDDLNADNTVVQNYKLSKSTNDGLVNEDVIVFTKRKTHGMTKICF